jgi:toxin ParE1/3/4
MAYRVVWSSKAIEDIDAIAIYIARDSPSYAAAVVQKIIDTTHCLSECPLTGTIVPEFSDSAMLEKCAYTYRIIYRVKEETVTIAAVIHTKRLLGLSG